ncbi:hypothetical protein AKJ65_02870 [candidate division MSBL1 archaeon SCGC-AAA259E19]|uniref:Uncharacterized protein n=1 Tax=candidate division MSBL1 archaeon SCGC-AAA259E19 TaxID=1698264 RepID=A0A133ULD0_9EURY|nr:hypothetical protein AKJ65_02870 [candidate division MSBL1 archaeon SCGC-AAA259E19]
MMIDPPSPPRLRPPSGTTTAFFLEKKWERVAEFIQHVSNKEKDKKRRGPSGCHRKAASEIQPRPNEGGGKR